MIRWRFVFTRLLIIACILGLLGWGLGPAARYVTVRSLEAAIGAKVEIEGSKIGFFPPRVHYNNIQIADPRSDKALRNAVEIDAIDLVIDGRALLQRRWVVETGRLTGLQIGSQRTSSGHFDPEPKEQVVESTGPSMLGKLISGAVDGVGDYAESMTDNLETVRRSKQLRDRWESDYNDLVTRARELEKQIREIRDSARGIDNPLRDWAQLDRTLARATAARQQLSTVRQTIDSLPERLQNDLASLDEARRIDLAKVDQYVPGDLSQSSNFGVDLMTTAIRDQVQRVRSYLDTGRTVADYTVVAPDTQRSRGVDYDLLGPARRPQMLIRRCELGGVLRADGDTYTLTGILENLASAPERLAEPTRARLRLEGPEIVRVELVRDRRAGTDIDLITLHWPQTEAGTMRLGNDHDAGITIQGGQRELWVQVRNQGDHMQGRLVSKQTGVQMDLSVDPKYADTPAVLSLSQSLAAVNSIEMDASFQGSWGDMDVDLDSNLGQIFQRAAQDAINGQVLATKQKLTDKVEAAHLKHSVELRQWLASRQTEARTLLASADKSIEEMSRKVVDEIGDADAYLGKLRSAIEGKLR